MIISFLEQDKSNKEDESRWFHYCTDHNIPYVITRKRTALGDVEWDYITLSPENDVFLRSQKEFIEYELNQLVKYYKHQKTIEHINSLTGYVKNLPAEHVNDFATDVCNTLVEAYERHIKTA
ncbi:MAG: hypothetical protein K9L79_08520 [Methylobacter tundripaludum]|nr:hypothetical protein [Methylobacter tundripaludum]